MRGFPAYGGKVVGELAGETVGIVRHPDDRPEHADHIQDFADAALIEGVNGHPSRIRVAAMSAWRSEKLRTRSGSSARIFGISAEVNAETRGFSCRALGGRTQ